MANREWTDFRPRGLGHASPDTHIPEGGAAVEFLDVIDDTDLDSGWYKYNLAIDFTLPAGKHMDLIVTLNESTGKTYRLESHVTSPLVNDFLISFLAPLFAPSDAINFGFTVQMPDQSGSSEAVIEAYQVTYEKWIDV